MANSSRIVLYLPPLPPDTLPKEFYSEIFTLYRACQSLQDGISRYCGVDPQDTSVRPQLVFSDTLLETNLTRMYPVASVPITRGQIVNLFNSAGALRARLAKADSMTTMAHGVCNETVAAGQQFEMYWQRGCLDSIVGLTVGANYFLSTAVAGQVQTVRPSVAGQIIQSVGFALAATTMQLDISSLAIQL
jgi:hypothetical protein